MPRYTGDSDAIDRGVSDINQAASNMLNILNNCVANLNSELKNWEGEAANSIQEIKERVVSLLNSDKDTFEKLGLYCQDASNLTEAAEDICASYKI